MPCWRQRKKAKGKNPLSFPWPLQTVAQFPEIAKESFIDTGVIFSVMVNIPRIVMYGATLPGWALSDNYLLLAAAVLEAGGYYNSGPDVGGLVRAELYTPAGGSGNRTSTGSLHEGRHRYTATLLSKGQVLVAKGLGNSG
jgi:hypothetical protein